MYWHAPLFATSVANCDGDLLSGIHLARRHLQRKVTEDECRRVAGKEQIRCQVGIFVSDQ